MNDNIALELINSLLTNPDKLQKILINADPKLLKEVLSDNSSNKKEDTNVKVNSYKVKGKAKRPLTEEEYNNIIFHILNGYTYTDATGNLCHCKPNKKVALALTMEATIGLRISDIVKFKLSSIKNGRIEIREKKTNKLQWRKINPSLINIINDYAIDNSIGRNDYLIDCTARNIQQHLKRVSDYLGYTNIGSHSFRKYFANYVYNKTNDILLVQTLLNHGSVSTTQRYLGTSQEKIDEISSSIDFSNIYSKSINDL